ncbi:hypothetical protein PRZ48_009502 [Zasmidium cellare]|uniref:Heterokaryon incompatibility domain-containing protein n=1 Tax=Zasmidium cellare TaxID=395010 RepID=A0ABR0EBW6_ZASCE|nr:hypothetical protein PRZ48_009502 [Zasmidium cellare]
MSMNYSNTHLSRRTGRIIAESILQRYVLKKQQTKLPDEESCDECPEQYEYSRLPPRSIRLLKIYPFSVSAREPLVVSLHTVSLDSSVPFDALSYTWGPPSWEAREATSTQMFTRVPRCYPVYCGADLLHVTKNLWDALVHIRQLQSNHEAQEQFKTHLRVSLSQHLWIDELCIDQEHLEERGQQVSMMGEIYSKANVVLAWLGDQEPITRNGLEMLRRLDIIMDASRSERVTSVSFTDEDFWRRMGLEPFTSEQWRAVIDVLTREWFTRTWVIQEVALTSKYAVCLCGTSAFSIVDIFKIVSFLLSSGWSNLVSHGLRTSYSKDHFKFIQRILSFHPFQWLRNIQERTGKARRYPFHLLQAYTFPLTFCFDPRDKVYAALGLAAEFNSDGDMTFDVDYKEPPADTYVRASKRCFGVSKSLDLLSVAVHLDRGSYIPELRNLPSWCPNYASNDYNDGRTQPLDLQPDDERTSKTFAASGSSSHIHTHADSTSPLLNTRGISCGKVFEVVELEFSFDWKQLAEHIDFLSRIPLPTSDPLIETFWRTLVYDMYDPDSGDQPYPARETTPDSFFILLYIMLNDDFVKGRHQDPQVREKLERMASAITKLTQIHPNAATLFPDFAHYLSLDEEVVTDASFWDSDGAQYPLYQNPVPATSLIYNTQAKARSRRFFRTGDHQLGVGFKATRPGDEVWLLAGGRVPYVLRPLSNGNYEFQGEAYVHGIMKGEAWPGDEGELVDVVLE